MAKPRTEGQRSTCYSHKREGRARGRIVNFLSNNIMYYTCYCDILNHLQNGKVIKYKELGISMAELLKAIPESRRQ